MNRLVEERMAGCVRSCKCCCYKEAKTMSEQKDRRENRLDGENEAERDTC